MSISSLDFESSASTSFTTPAYDSPAVVLRTHAQGTPVFTVGCTRFAAGTSWPGGETRNPVRYSAGSPVVGTMMESTRVLGIQILRKRADALLFSGFSRQQFRRKKLIIQHDHFSCQGESRRLAGETACLPFAAGAAAVPAQWSSSGAKQGGRESSAAS